MGSITSNLISRIIYSLGVILFSCLSAEQDKVNADGNQIPIRMKYAKQFEVWKKGNITEVIVYPGADTEHGLHYLLVPHDYTIPDSLAADQIIQVPVKKIVATSTSHIPFLDLLKSTEYLAGFPETKYISSASVRERIEKGLVADVGSMNGLNFESLISLQPELVASYISGPDRTQLDQLDQSNIPYVLIMDFMEETPLGRAEWLKFMGLLIGEFDFADSVFTQIEQNYLELLSLTNKVIAKPSVFSGILYGDTWFAPGANSFAAKLIQDAGGSYTWNDLDGTGSVELSLEAVLDRNIDTQFWIGTGEFTSKVSLVDADPRYSHFKAYKTDQVYNYHGKIGPTGGFEYFELGGARPDWVLSDLIKILHPDLLPGYQPYFYRKLD